MRTRACPPEGPWVYLQQQAAFPEMLEDVRLPEGIERRRLSVHLWLGPAGVTSPLHFDVAHNVFVQILGRKRFLLVDPAAAAQLDPFPPGSRHWNKSRLDLESAEGAARLRAVASQTVVAEVGPGDALLLPALWWHHVETLKASLSLSFWWPPPARRLLEADAWPLLRLLYERDRLVSLRQASLDLEARGGLIGLARVALERGAADAAVLLAAAAVEARLRVLVPLHEPDQPRLVRELPRLASRLAALGLLDRASAGALAERAPMLDRVRSGEGRAATPAEAANWVTEGARLLGP
jgi:HEPN domain-containing protein